jgi:hypothetical protein
MPDPIRAKSLSLSYCAHGTVYINLHDEAGEIFALASMSVETAADVLDDLSDACEEALAIQVAAAGDEPTEVH